MRKLKKSEKPICTQIRVPNLVMKDLKKVVGKTQFSQNQFIIIAIMNAIQRYKKEPLL